MTDTPIVTISFFRFPTAGGRAWALAMMGAARLSMPRVPGIGFWKLCGAGTDEGFTPVLIPRVFAILCSWPDEATARKSVSDTAIFQRYRQRATEHWTIFLEATSVRGAWSGKVPFVASRAPASGPLAALTRASIKPSVALKFWRRVPDVSRMIGSDPNVTFKIGIGEVPLLHQVTFSIWPDAAAMAGFARISGPHAAAIASVRDGNWFSEELYARFAILGEAGTWEGKSPLAALERLV